MHNVNQLTFGIHLFYVVRMEYHVPNREREYHLPHVDYQVVLVENQPTHTWIEFHLKSNSSLKLNWMQFRSLAFVNFEMNRFKFHANK